MASTITFNLTTSTAKLQKQLKKYGQKVATRAARLTIPELRIVIPTLVMKGIKNTEEWIGLSGGLQGDFDRDWQAILGLHDPDSVLSELEDYILESINVKSISFSSKQAIRITVLGSDRFEQMFSEDFSSYISPTSGDDIPWLLWMVTGESDDVAKDIVFNINAVQQKFSRSGRALMLGKHGSWHISDHGIDADGISNNFIRSGTELAIPEIQKVASEFFIANLKLAGKS